MRDLIERQAGIDALEAKKDKSANGDIGCFYNTIIQNNIDPLKGLPPAQPERKTGKWILKPNIYGVAYCSECDYELHTNNTNFCPNCGTDMRDNKKEDGE